MKVLLASILTICALAPRLDAEPWLEHTVGLESGFLWQVGSNTSINYRLVPTQLTYRSPETFGFDFASGHLSMRSRLGLIGAWVETGPESFYAALSASPSIEWWDRTGTWSVFAGIGGGAGFIDSGDVEGGQGQDFTLHWFARTGLERTLTPNSSVQLGLMFIHLSNGGQTDPNPGIDALGFTFGYSVNF